MPYRKRYYLIRHASFLLPLLPLELLLSPFLLSFRFFHRLHQRRIVIVVIVVIAAFGVVIVVIADVVDVFPPEILRSALSAAVGVQITVFENQILNDFEATGVFVAFPLGVDTTCKRVRNGR